MCIVCVVWYCGQEVSSMLFYNLNSLKCEQLNIKSPLDKWIYNLFGEIKLIKLYKEDPPLWKFVLLVLFPSLYDHYPLLAPLKMHCPHWTIPQVSFQHPTWGGVTGGEVVAFFQPTLWIWRESSTLPLVDNN